MYIKLIFKKIKNSEAIKDTLWLFILQCVDKMMPLIIVPYLMIVIGAEKYGNIGFSLASILFLNLIVDFGFNFSASKRISIAQSIDIDEINRIASSTFTAKILLFICSVPIFLLILYIIPSIRCYLVTVLCLLPMVVGSILNAGWLFQGLGKIRINAIITSICRLTIFPLTFLFVKNEKDYNLAALIHGSVYFSAGLISFIFIHYKKWFKYTKASVRMIKTELSESFPLFLSSAAGATYTQLFTIILGVITNSTAVGTYSAAERIMRTLCIAIYNPIVTAYYPKLSKLGIEKRIQGEKLLSKITFFLMITMIFLGICLFVFAPLISNLIGKSYIGLDRLIRIMAITPLFISLGGVAGQMGLLALGNNLSKRKFRNTYLYAAPISILLVSFLAWWFEETGAAIAMVLTELFIFIAMYYSLRREQ